MAKLLAVEGDPVTGTDTHTLTGFDTSAPNPLPFAGTGDYTYRGSVTGGLSDFVRVGGTPLALTASACTLDEGESAGAHAAKAGSGFTPTPATPLNPTTLNFVPSTGVGDGRPSEGTGSALLTVNGTRALLDGDSFDTCGVPGGKASSTLEATGQDFVTCSV